LKLGFSKQKVVIVNFPLKGYFNGYSV